MALQDTKKVRDIKKASPRLGVPAKDGSDLFREWKRKYPDLSSDDGCYIAPCTDAKYICIDTSGKSHPSQKTVDAWIDTIEDEIAKVISSIDSDTGKRRLDNPSYLQCLFEFYREVLIARVRFGGSSKTRLLQAGRDEYHNKRQNYWQDRRKKG